MITEGSTITLALISSLTTRNRFFVFIFVECMTNNARLPNPFLHYAIFLYYFPVKNMILESTRVQELGVCMCVCVCVLRITDILNVNFICYAIPISDILIPFVPFFSYRVIL